VEDEIAESDEVSQDSSDKRTIGSVSKEESFKSSTDKSDLMPEEEWLTELRDDVQSSTLFARGARLLTKKARHMSAPIGRSHVAN
jgi:hypothetical protein